MCITHECLCTMFFFNFLFFNGYNSSTGPNGQTQQEPIHFRLMTWTVSIHCIYTYYMFDYVAFLVVFFGSRQNLKWKTSNNLIRLMSFCLATIFTLTSDTLNCWVISPVSKMAIDSVFTQTDVCLAHTLRLWSMIYINDTLLITPA